MRINKLHYTGVATDAIAGAVECSSEIRAQLAEVAIAHTLGQQLSSGGSCVQVTKTLIIRKEEKFVLDNRAADGRAEFVVAEFRFLDHAVRRMPWKAAPNPLRPPVRGQIGVQRVIAEKFVHAAVKVIGPRLG